MADAKATTTLATTRFRRPVLESAVVNAKAGCLYPNNARMLIEARSKATPTPWPPTPWAMSPKAPPPMSSSCGMAKSLHPIANGTFLAGITRARHIANLTANGIKVHECVLSFDDVRAADEVFLSGNMSKVTPVTEFEGTMYQHGPVTRQVREMYWDWALGAG